jgi:putative sigma-54 modulation protein
VELQVRGKNLKLSESLHGHVRRRVEFSLARFSARLVRVFVLLADASGPRGCRNRSCRIAVRLCPAGSVLVEHSGTDLYAAIDQACDRAGRAVAREVERERDTRQAAIRPQWARI